MNKDESNKNGNELIKKSIGEEIDLFVRQIDSLADTLPGSMKVIDVLSSKSGREYERFVAQDCPVVGEKDGKKVFKIPGERYFLYRRLRGRFERAKLANLLVPRIFLVSLISQFDAFLGRLIRQLFTIKPEALDSSGTSLSLSQIIQLGSVEAAKEYVINKEIETVLRKSHAEQFDWLENKFGLRLRVDLPVWPTFVEVTERRNLFVHASGVVNDQYLKVCSQHGAILEEEIAVGAALTVSRAYFEMAHECIFEIGVKLAQVLWRKLAPEDIDRAEKSLLDVGYELLEESRFRLACCLLDFATETLKKHQHPKEEIRLRMVIDRAQAYKWSGQDDVSRQIVDGVDWSATALRFQMAQAVLLDDVDRALEIMQKIGKSGEITEIDYREWPLFRRIRQTQAFSEAFERIFGEPFDYRSD